MCYHVFFVIRLATREVQIAGTVPEPHGVWMKQVARNLTDGLDGFLAGCRYLIRRGTYGCGPEAWVSLSHWETLKPTHPNWHRGTEFNS